MPVRGHLDAQLDAERGDDLPVQESLAAIDREVDTLASLIDDLFTLSRLEEGVLPVDAAAFDVAALARESAAAIRPYALSAARVSVNAQVAEELPHALGDPTRTTQVINNLLHNAVRHTPEGGVVMVIAELDTSRTWIHVTVRDTGVGIPPDVLERIFDRYYRGDTIGEKGGAGIGLSIVSQLVQMQGGQVWAESNVGEGTAISFSLRVASPQ